VNTSHSERFFDGPISVHYREVLLYVYIYTYNRWLQEGEKERVRTCYMMMMVVVVTRRDYVFLINMVQMFFKFFLFDNTQ